MEHKNNDWIRSKINFLMGPQEPLLAAVKKRKLAWFGPVTRLDSLFNTFRVLWRTGDRKGWMDIKEWTSLPMPDMLTGAS